MVGKIDRTGAKLIAAPKPRRLGKGGSLETGENQKQVSIRSAAEEHGRKRRKGAGKGAAALFPASAHRSGALRLNLEFSTSGPWAAQSVEM